MTRCCWRLSMLAMPDTKVDRRCHGQRRAGVTPRRMAGTRLSRRHRQQGAGRRRAVWLARAAGRDRAWSALRRFGRPSVPACRCSRRCVACASAATACSRWKACSPVRCRGCSISTTGSQPFSALLLEARRLGLYRARSAFRSFRRRRRAQAADHRAQCRLCAGRRRGPGSTAWCLKRCGRYRPSSFSHG